MSAFTSASVDSAPMSSSRPVNDRIEIPCIPAHSTCASRFALRTRSGRYCVLQHREKTLNPVLIPVGNGRGFVPVMLEQREPAIVMGARILDIAARQHAQRLRLAAFQSGLKKVVPMIERARVHVDQECVIAPEHIVDRADRVADLRRHLARAELRKSMLFNERDRRLDGELGQLFARVIRSPGHNSEQ